MQFNQAKFRGEKKMFPQVKPLDHEVLFSRKAWSWPGFKDLIA